MASNDGNGFSGVCFEREDGTVPWIADPEGTAFFRRNRQRDHFSTFLLRGNKEGADRPKPFETNVFPVLRNRRKYLDDSALALEQHLLYTGCESEVSFQRERTVNIPGFSALRLIAIDMEGIPQDKAGSERSQRLGRLLSVAGTCFEVGQPGVGITGSPIRSVRVQAGQGRIDDLSRFRALTLVQQPQGMNGQCMGEMAV